MNVWQPMHNFWNSRFNRKSADDKDKNVFDDDNIGNIPQLWSFVSLLDSFVILDFISLNILSFCPFFLSCDLFFFFGRFFGFFCMESCINSTFFIFLFFWSLYFALLVLVFQSSDLWVFWRFELLVLKSHNIYKWIRIWIRDRFEKRKIFST